jgi:hypothetical protein
VCQHEFIYMKQVVVEYSCIRGVRLVSPYGDTSRGVAVIV